MSEEKFTCSGTNKAGKSCSRAVENEGDRCWQHPLDLSDQEASQNSQDSDTQVDNEAVEETKTPSKAGQDWLATEGLELRRKGHGQRNIIHKAAQAAGKSFDDANVVCALPRLSLEEKVLSLFD